MPITYHAPPTPSPALISGTTASPSLKDIQQLEERIQTQKSELKVAPLSLLEIQEQERLKEREKETEAEFNRWWAQEEARIAAEKASATTTTDTSGKKQQGGSSTSQNRRKSGGGGSQQNKARQPGKPKNSTPVVKETVKPNGANKHEAMVPATAKGKTAQHGAPKHVKAKPAKPGKAKATTATTVSSAQAAPGSSTKGPSAGMNPDAKPFEFIPGRA